MRRSDADSLHVLDEPARVAKALSPIRLALLGALGAPDSAAGLARRLSMSRQKVNYHLRELERLGFVELDEERQKRGCVERRMRVTARAFVIDPSLLGAPEEGAGDRFSSAHLVASASRAVHDVARLRERARRSRRRLLTLSMELEIAFDSPDAFAAFSRDLARAFAALAERYHRPDAPGARSYRTTVLVHPEPAARERPPSAGGETE